MNLTQDAIEGKSEFRQDIKLNENHQLEASHV